MTDNSGTAADMEPVQQALSLYRRRHFTECAELCERHASKQLQWLGMLALTQHAWLDELELEGLQSLAEELLDDQATAQTGRPGTSLRAPPPPTGGGRPVTREGRPLTGIRRRPQSRTAATRHGVERALTTAAGRTARPTTAAPAMVQELAEFGRLGAASSGWPDKPWLSKPLFRFLYHQRGDVRQALELAGQERATDCCGWWSLQRGRCLLRLGMLREAEHQFRKAAEAGDPQPRAFLWLARVQLQMDQPLAAVEAYRRGLDKFPNEAALVAPMARVYETPAAAGHADGRAVQQPGAVLLLRAAIRHGAHLLRPGAGPGRGPAARRRLVQPGARRTGQYVAGTHEASLPRSSVYHAQAPAAKISKASSGDKTLATRAFRLALVYDNCHAESYNNLGVLELTNGNVDQAASYFVTAGEMAPELCEAQYNRALVLEQMGDLQGCARAASKCSQHASSADLLQKVQAFFQRH
ncbi:tetratricopeptide repeat protein 8 isoform X3 [Dermacentor variabilis]|uniref:tetratricopeptide repeat protein 8 isoform X3 n=1 Tax=Dermacentor variabilis TaxID=34621 RepID=UPI003F5CA7FB